MKTDVCEIYKTYKPQVVQRLVFIDTMLLCGMPVPRRVIAAVFGISMVSASRMLLLYKELHGEEGLGVYPGTPIEPLRGFKALFPQEGPDDE
jgi:hypothetical protein